jgi:GNAT superfamily N-acetyltransferase
MGPDPPADPYPVELERDVETIGGGLVHLRPIRPTDDGHLTDFHERLSPQSVYRRFFFVHPRLTAAEIDRFTHVDYRDRLALIVEHGGQLIAVGRYERIAGTTEAEVAFVVDDRYQHRGIATILLEELADSAWKHGIETFVAQTLIENRDMLDVFAGSGFPVSTTTEYGTVSVRFSIRNDEAYRSVRALRHPPVDGPARSEDRAPVRPAGGGAPVL